MKHLLLLFCFILSFNISLSQQWWTEQTSGVTTTLTSVSVGYQYGSGPFAIVWVCGYNGVVLRTTNGGTNWVNRSGGIPNTVSLINICAFDSVNALVSGYTGSNTWVWKTTTGGSSWTQVFSQTGGFVDGIAARPNSLTECVLLGDPVGGRWTIFRSTNSGSNWDSTGCYLVQNGAEAGWNNALYWSKFSGAMGDSGLWFGTNNFRIYHSVDRGFTWSVQATPAEQNSYALGFMQGAGQIGGTNLYRSTNYGYTWTPISGTLGTGNYGGVVGFGVVVDNPLFQGYTWYVRSDTKIYKGSSGGGFAIEYTAPAGNFRHINTHDYSGPIWAVRDNGGISACVNCRVLGVSQLGTETPAEYSLGQNYPNPFNPLTRFEFMVPSRSYVKVCVYSSIGELVEVINDGAMNAGIYGVNWNAEKYSSGVYYYSMIAKDEASQKTFKQTKKMVLVK